MSQVIRSISLFAGIGGFDLGFHHHNIRPEVMVEKDKSCQAVLQRLFPGVPIHDDITTFDGKQYRNSVELICGGFPCQPFSSAGKRKGARDDRYLWPEMLRIIKEVFPYYVIGENVDGLTSMALESSERDVGCQTFERNDYHDDTTTIERTEQLIAPEIIKDLEQAGYSVQPFIIPASGLDASHQRKRVWFLAVLEYPANDGCH